ncbi:MAG: MopE-related protein [Myxococcota bacterium]
MFILTLALLTACSGPEPTPNTPDQDGDGDGWPGSTDCDDGDPLINPSASELCDPAAVDEDCDDAANDLDPEGPTDPSDWYPDGDGDGFAAEGGAPLSACEAPAGHTATAGDCDDTDGNVHPGAEEICDALDVDEDCNGLAEDLDPATRAGSFLTWYADADADGWGDLEVTSPACEAPPGHVAESGDCDDGNGAISPDASEVCDDADADEDCDGGGDDADVTGAAPIGRTSFYVDEDGDGYGGEIIAEACDLPAGHTRTATDCNDSDITISPSAIEVCDTYATDEDCNGPADDADPGATGRVAWYADHDGDGFGGTDVTEACVAPPSHYADALDCDDDNATIYPGGQETCDTSDADEDCDGLADDLDPTAIGQTPWYEDADGDGWGTIDSTVSTCDVPAGFVASSDDCDDTTDAVSPGEAEVCSDGVDQDCDGEDSDCRYAGEYDIETGYDTKIYGTSGDAEFGMRLAAGDFDGDGVGDVMVGSPSGSYYPAGYGVVWAYSGPFTTASRSAASDDTGLIYNTDEDHAGAFGELLVNVGDIDADGADDIVIGGADQAAWLYLGGGTGAATSDTFEDSFTCTSGTAAGAHVSGTVGWACGYGPDDTYGANRGSAIVYEGIGTTHTTYIGESEGDYAGTSVAAGDVNGDGITDLWVGAYGDDDAAASAGAAYLLYGPAPGGVANLSTADAKVIGLPYSNAFGTRVVMPGDIDADGYDDLMAAAPFASITATWEGRVYLFTTVPAGSSSASAATATFVGENSSSFLGSNNFVGGDVNGDEDLDLLFGTTLDADGGASAGAVWLLYGPHVGTVPLTGTDAVWRGDDAYDQLGSDVALIPDIDGDGDSEIAMGALDGDNGGILDRGVMWIIDGR